MGRALQSIKVLCVFFAVDIGLKMGPANTAFIGTYFNSSTVATTNEEKSSEISTLYNNVTFSNSVSAETTFVISQDNVTSKIVYGCSFGMIDVGIRQQLQSYITANKELIFLHFYLVNPTTSISYGPNDTIYNIFTIVRTVGGFGNELLAMHPQFEQFSIGTLVFGVEHINIPLRVMSLDCFTQRELQYTLRKIVKTELGLLQKRNDGGIASLCQTHAEDIKGIASFYYNCCAIENNDEFVCNRLQTNLWMDVLLVGMNICYVIVFLYSPLLIPTSWYKADIHGITLRIERNFHLKLSDELYTENQFKTEEKTVQLLKRKKQYPLKVKEINLKILEMNTVSTDYVPAGIFHYLYRTFIKCHVKDHEYVKDCCNTDVCKFRFCNCPVWHKCLLPLMQHIFLLILLIPWAIRILFYYSFESEDRTNRETFAQKKNLEYPNILQWSLTYSLKPNHLFFICVYGFIAFIPFCKIFLKLAMQRSGFNDNRRSSSESMKLIQILVLPCRKLGLVGCLISPFYIMLISPLVIIWFILPFIPIIKVSWTLLYGITNAFWTMFKEKSEAWKCFDALWLFVRSVF
ncbi:Hypothetical predicted protein [Mytilus galloprovincialis]|uniref:Uncharacterized protein n=1 Tax=Mytilus galloprovincialis TaxID=29158 RepID=A0A8B6H9E5_MYTGA|nr:Hypothetical predicted protein [Mytilus galloprovincialis]